MPAIVNCPKCDAQVSLPVGADPKWQVRCPLCVQEFPLAEALDKAPPELIVVDRAGAADGDSPEWANQRAATVDGAATFSDIEIALDDSSVAMHDTDAVTASAGGDGHVALEVAADSGSIGGLSTHGMPRSTRNGHHWIGRLVGVAGGGVMGLMFGYLALLWIGGPSRDFLKVGPKLPSFVLPSSFARSVAVRPPQPRPQDNSTSIDTAAANGNGHRSPGERAPRGPTARADGRKVSAATRRAARPGGGRRQSAQPAPVPDRDLPHGSWAPVESAATPVPPEPWVVAQGPAAPVAKVDQAIETARNACDILARHSLKDVKARPAMGTAYRELCDLAEAVTNPETGIDPDLARSRRMDAGELVVQLAERPGKRHELALIADYWIDAPQRSGRGIVLVGRVERIRRIAADDRFEMQLSLSDKRSVAVLSFTRPRLKIGDRALVLGSLVAQPSANSTALRHAGGVTVRSGVIRRVLEPAPDSA